eukprot:6971444-Prymnesium_polylepis.1
MRYIVSDVSPPLCVHPSALQHSKITVTVSEIRRRYGDRNVAVPPPALRGANSREVHRNVYRHLAVNQRCLCGRCWRCGDRYSRLIGLSV